MAPEDLPVFTGTTEVLCTQKRREGREERGEEKGPLALITFISPTLENDKKALATHRLRHRDRAVSFSKIQADIYLYTFVGHLFVYSLVNEFI